ncbi:hypothetical protein BvCmsKKP062_02594 [Escherichia coli]|nr:hypothetical protein BvCmsKKP062_02594 [Escherichia coli]
MCRPDSRLSRSTTLLPSDPALPLLPGNLTTCFIPFDRITVPRIHNFFVLLEHGRLRPLIAVRELHHAFRHVLTIELRFVECHIRLQYTVGQHVIQPRISPLYHHCRQTRHGSARPLNHIPHQVFETISDPVQLVTHCCFQVKIATHQITAPPEIHPKFLHIAARCRLRYHRAPSQGIKQFV